MSNALMFREMTRLFEDFWVEGSKIQADYQDGVLRIAVPKAESARPRLIQISGA